MTFDLDPITPYLYAISHDWESEDCWCEPDVVVGIGGEVMYRHYQGVC